MRRRFGRARRREPVASWGFLRPHHRVQEDREHMLERLRQVPACDASTARASPCSWA
ncbi:MAG: hypothetical protein ACE5G2_12785 [Candidatus Krumholzibacteriia bacterium]